MSAITTINASDLITNSRTVINNNFSALNTDKLETSYLDTDTSLTANSDVKIATQKATKAYVDAGGNVNASTTQKGIVEEATAAEISAGTAVGATGARLYMNPSMAGTKFVTTQVYNGSFTQSVYQDLDLSSVVGVRQCMVMLVFTGVSSIYCKRKGTSYTYTGSGSVGVSGGLNGGNSCNLIVATDASGVIQWTSSNVSATATINVESYW